MAVEIKLTKKKKKKKKGIDPWGFFPSLTFAATAGVCNSLTYSYSTPLHLLSITRKRYISPHKRSHKEDIEAHQWLCLAVVSSVSSVWSSSPCIPAVLGQRRAGFEPLPRWSLERYPSPCDTGVTHPEVAEENNARNCNLITSPCGLIVFGGQQCSPK